MPHQTQPEGRPESAHHKYLRLLDPGGPQPSQLLLLARTRQNAATVLLMWTLCALPLGASSATAKTVEEDAGALVYVGPPIPQPTDGSMAMPLSRSAARSAGGDLYPAVPGTTIPFPRDPDGRCADTEVQLMTSEIQHDGRFRFELSADLEEDAETGQCFVNVVTNRLIKHLEYSNPYLPAARDEVFYGGEHQYRATVKADLKRKLADGTYSPYNRAKVYVHMKWWDHFLIPGAAVYGGFDPKYHYWASTRTGWVYGGPEAFWENFVTDGLDGFVGALASGAYYRTSPPVGSAWAEAYFVALPLGRFYGTCKRHNLRADHKIAYRWFCRGEKRLDIVQF